MSNTHPDDYVLIKLICSVSLGDTLDFSFEKKSPGLGDTVWNTLGKYINSYYFWT